MLTGVVRLGIDFGTSNTVAMLAWPDGRVRPLLFDGSPLLPSAVCVQPGGDSLVGRDAVHAARAYPDGFEPNPKRRIDDGTVLLGAVEVPVVELFGAVLGAVFREALRVAHTAVGQVVLTCPAVWGAPRRQTLLDGAVRAGIVDPVLVIEPVAAATYFVRVVGAQVPVGSCVVVYDLGGGTFDASVVRRTATGFDVLAVEGLGDVGGLDIDDAIVAHLGAVYAARDARTWQRLVQPATAADRRVSRQMWEDVRTGKEMLSRATSTLIHVPLLDLDAPLGREQLEQLATPVLRRTVLATRAAVRAARVGGDQIAGVFLVGGASRIPLVATLLHRSLGVAPTVIEQPELVVAEGSLYTEPPAPPLPAELQQVVDHPLAVIRSGAAQELARLVREGPRNLALAATVALQRLTGDDNPAVRAAAAAALGEATTVPGEAATPVTSPPPVLTLSASVLDFGRIQQDHPSEPRTVRFINTGGGDLDARATTSAGWIGLRYVADELFVAVDAASPGKHHGTITVDSNGGSATISVEAIVVAEPPAAPPPTAQPPDPATVQSPVREPVTAPDLGVERDRGVEPAPVPESTGRRRDRVEPPNRGRWRHRPSGTRRQRGARPRSVVLAALLTVLLAATASASSVGPPGVVLAHGGGSYGLRSRVLFVDDRTVVVGSWDGVVALWDVESRRPVRTPLFRGGSVLSMAYSPKRGILATATADRDGDGVRLWDLAGHRLLGQPLTGHTPLVSGLAFSPDGDYLATVDGQYVRLWDVDSQRKIGEWSPEYPTAGVAFCADGTTLATGGYDDAVQFWDAGSRKRIGDQPPAPDQSRDFSNSPWIAVSPDGRTVAVPGDGQKSVRLWDVADRRQVGEPFSTEHGEPFGDQVFAATFSPDGHTLAVATWDLVRLWDIAGHRQIGKPLKGYTAAVVTVAYSPNGRMLAGGLNDGSVRLWTIGDSTG